MEKKSGKVSVIKEKTKTSVTSGAASSERPANYLTAPTRLPSCNMYCWNTWTDVF